MSITLFTLQNNTSNQVGPYGLNQLTLQGNSSAQISPPLNGMLADNVFIADLWTQKISITVAGVPIQAGIAFQFFSLLSQASLSNNYVLVSGNQTVTAKTGAGILHSIIIGNNTTGGSAIIYDSTSGEGTEIMSLSFGTPSGGLLSTSGQQGPVYINTLNVQFLTGLTIVTSGSQNNSVTVVYQ